MSSLRLIDELVEDNWIWNKKITKIGLDGKGVGKRKQVFNLTNLNDNQVIGVFPNLSQKNLIEKLLKIDLRHRLEVKEVCIDMDTFFLKVIRICFPNAKIVVDHFHIIQWALKLIKDQKTVWQEIKKNKYPINRLLAVPIHKLKKKEFDILNNCFKEIPELKESWKILHQLRSVYWQDSFKEGYYRLNQVIRLCNRSGIIEMKELARTLERWKEEILNYYLSKTTNAYTEGIHNHFERIKRNHFGVRNINRFCKRLLFCLIPWSVFVEIFVQRC